MKRRTVRLAAVGLTLMFTATLATAQTIPLLGGVYQVSVTGWATQAWFVPGTSFSEIPGFLYVLPPSVTQGRAVEMCLFVNTPPEEPPLFLIGSTWLATWLGCGSRLAQGGGPFTSLDTHIVGSVSLSADRQTIYAFPPGEAASQQEGFLVFENIFPTGQSTPQIVSGEYWYATTADNGQTVSGHIQLSGYESGGLGLSLGRYVASYRGTLIERIP
jgi:hypothetical protein